ncbi:hypothetical protein Btru_051604 [Bulinus truncatus]|nr:hypothetical protein Btru_051604 [Bulinus truncatus]
MGHKSKLITAGILNKLKEQKLYSVLNNHIMENKMKQSLEDRRNQKKSFAQKCKTSILASFVAFGFSLAALILAVMLAIRSQSHSKESMSHRESNCINCAYLLNEFKDSQLDGTLESSENFGKPCCAENAQELAIFLKKVMHAQESESTNKQSEETNNSPQKGPVIAHKSFSRSGKVEGICKANTEIIHSDVHLVSFNETENETGEIVKQIKIIKDGLQIIFPGMYYVYSSVKFQTKEKQTENQALHQFVFRERRKKCDRLLKSTHTLCRECSESKDTAFTGGVFYLLKGDVIRVLISEQGLKDYSVENSFLGALLLSSK